MVKALACGLAKPLAIVVLQEPRYVKMTKLPFLTCLEFNAAIYLSFFLLAFKLKGVGGINPSGVPSLFGFSFELLTDFAVLGFDGSFL